MAETSVGEFAGYTSLRTCAVLLATVSACIVVLLLGGAMSNAQSTKEEFEVLRAEVIKSVDPLDPERLEDKFFTRIVPLELHVALVAGADGGALMAGGTGWLNLRIRNPGKDAVDISTAYSLAWAGPRPTPSYSGSEQFYAGFELGQLTCEFVASDGKVVHTIHLSPPDDPLALGPGGSIEVWRSIRAPEESGTYKLRVRLDTLTATAIWARTVTGGWPSEPFHSALVTAEADGVEVLDSNAGS